MVWTAFAILYVALATTLYLLSSSFLFYFQRGSSDSWSLKVRQMVEVRAHYGAVMGGEYLWDGTVSHSNDLQLIYKKKLENAWQSLAYSPLGAIVSPLANTCEKHLLTNHLSA